MAVIPHRGSDRRPLYRAVLNELVGRYPFAVQRHDFGEFDDGVLGEANGRDIAGAIRWLEHRGLAESGGAHVWATLPAVEAIRLVIP